MPTKGESVPNYIRETLRYYRSEIDRLMSVAPHKPPDANRLPRNTEYPFHNAQGVLIAPADPGIFQRAEIDSHMKVAGTLFNKARTLITMIERGPR